MRITRTTAFETQECSFCGVLFALAERFADLRRQDKRVFHCPWGHEQWFPGETDRAKYKRLLTDERERHESTRRQRDTIEASRRAFKGQVTKIRKRVGNGVCPCCNRSFANLRRHMDGQHPGYEKGAERTE